MKRIAVGTALLLCVLIDCAVAHSPKWQLVKSVPDGANSIEFVVVPEEKQRDLAYYSEAANTVCEKRTYCSVFFWANSDHIPNSAVLDGPAMQTLAGQYERSPSYSEPHLRLACWLYPSKSVAEKMNCFYMPGAKDPPDA
jgi:hypothetical protein